MPADLPGLYWDEARNRYFPISSRPKEAVKPIPPISSKPVKLRRTGEHDHEVTSRRTQHYSPWHVGQARNSSSSHSQISGQLHEILSFHYAHTSRMKRDRIPTFGGILAFHSAKVDDRQWRLVGDDQGWLYSDKTSSAMEDAGLSYWSADWNLSPSCPISSISMSDTRVLSTCLGPGRFSVQDLNSPERTFLLNLGGVNDIRASHIQGKEVALGARNKIVHIQDIDVSYAPQNVRMKTDVFSIIQKTHLVFAGTRNGSVERVDLRMASHSPQKLFDTRFGASPRSSVLYLNIIREHELLLSHLNGDLVSFDLRFPVSGSMATPLKVFEGHVNTYHNNLGIAVDPEHDFLFAAGQDSRIRGWSLRTGAPLIPPPLTTSTTKSQSPFSAVFPSPISALQVTEEPGISLWAAYDHDLIQYHLGQLGP